MTTSFRPFGIYIHWPFCLSKCPYCDFNSHVRDQIDNHAWEEAYRQELRHSYTHIPDHRPTSIFFGGGTPSLMPADLVHAILSEIQTLWGYDPLTCEITLEANPTSSERSRFIDFHHSGINRVSIGVQSLRQDALRFLGRQHSDTDALATIAMAKDIFPRVSFDLIYARPGQTLKDWENELHQALSMGTTHMSLYQLTIEKGTAFYTAVQRGDFIMPNDDVAADFFDITQHIMTDKGLLPYEISNYAAHGQESIHNKTYWTYHDFIGIGPGAHGRLTLQNHKTAIKRIKAPEPWRDRVLAQGHGTDSSTIISATEAVQEMMMMGLRLTEGVNMTDMATWFPAYHMVLNQEKIDLLMSEGLLHQTTTHLRTTPQGRPLLNKILDFIIN